MRNLSRVSLVFAASAALIGSVALPATAATTSGTDVTVTVPTGNLSISAPGTAALGSIAPGASADAALAGVTVTDTRAGAAGWQAQVSMTALTSGANSIPASAATYTPAAASVTGTATVTPATVTDLSTAKTVQTATAVSGNNEAIWGATLNIAVPAGALAGDYTGTLTHSTL